MCACCKIMTLCKWTDVQTHNGFFTLLNRRVLQLWSKSQISMICSLVCRSIFSTSCRPLSQDLQRPRDKPNSWFIGWTSTCRANRLLHCACPLLAMQATFPNMASLTFQSAVYWRGLAYRLKVMAWFTWGLKRMQTLCRFLNERIGPLENIQVCAKEKKKKTSTERL